MEENLGLKQLSKEIITLSIKQICLIRNVYNKFIKAFGISKINYSKDVVDQGLYRF